MELGDLFKKIFGSSAAIPVDERTLSGANEDALASSLEKLGNGERGWIPLAQAALLFSTEDRQYAFGELTTPARTGSRCLQRNTGAHWTSGRPKVACTSARMAKRDSAVGGPWAKVASRRSSSRRTSGTSSLNWPADDPTLIERVEAT
jgi:hypothetical protein